MVQYYQIELLNMKNPESRKFATNMLYQSTFVNGRKGNHLEINYYYVKEFGTEEQVKEAKKNLDNFFEYREKFIKKLEERGNKLPERIKTVSGNFNFLGVNYFVKLRRD